MKKFSIRLMAGFMGVMLVLASLKIVHPTLTAGDTPVYRQLSTGVTNIAANTTNTAVGGTFDLFHAQRPIHLYMTGSGTAATTNGSLIAFFQSSYDSNTWDSASTSNIKLTMSSLGAATNTVSDWFESGGIRYLRVGRIENNFNGTVSNIAIVVGMPGD